MDAGSTSRTRVSAASAVLLAAVVLLPLVMWPGLHYAYPIPKVTVFRFAAGALLLIAFVSLAAQPRRPIRLEWPDVLLLAFTGWLGVTALLSDWPRAAILGLPPRFEGWLGFAGYAVFYGAGRRSRLADRRILGPALSAMGAVVGLLAVADALGWFRPPGHGAFGFRAVSTLGNPVFLGSLEVLCLPVAIAHVLRAQRGRELTIASAVALPIGLGLVLSFGRAAWLGVMVGGFVVAGSAWKRRRDSAAKGPSNIGPGRRGLVTRRLLAAVVVAIGFVAVVALLGPGGRSELGRVSRGLDPKAPGVESRLLLWRTAGRLAIERPVAGWGLDTFLSDAARVRPLRLLQVEGADAYPDRPHDQWLYLAYAGGAPAILLYLAFLASLLARGVTTLGNGAISLERRLAVGALVAAVVAYEMQSLAGFSLPMTTPLAAALQGALVGLTPALRRRHFVFSGRGTRTPWARGVAAALCLALALPFFAVGVAQAGADLLFARAAAQPWDAPALLSRAVSLSPADPLYAVALSQVLRARGTPGDLTEAERVLRTWIGRNPYHPDPAVELGQMLEAEGRAREAQEVYSEVLHRDPYQPQALAALAGLELTAGQPEAARALLERRATVVDDAAGWYRLGQAREATGAIPAASVAYRRAQTLAPGWAEPRQALERLASAH